MKKEIIKPIIIGIALLLIIGGLSLKKITKQEYQTTDVDVVLSLEDTLTKNAIWCGTFNLLWNDLKSEVAKQDIVFTPQLEIVKNLNKGTFTKEFLSEDSYVKKYGPPTFALKKEIEEEIAKKFNEKSDILDDFEWNDENSEDYFFYTMLKKEFTFPKVFTKLEKGTFKNTKNVNYFGIDSTTKKEVFDQVRVLYYHAKEDFALTLLTNEKEEVILIRGIEKNTFKEIWESLKEQEKEYQGSKSFNSGDTLRVPYLNLKLKKEFTELEHKDFSFANGEKYYIEKALQTISLELDEKGGKIKSEAGMHTKNFSAMETSDRKFYLDDNFVIFLKEEGKSLPYFAAQIDDIEKFS